MTLRPLHARTGVPVLPSHRHLRYFLVLAGAITLWFLVVYGGCDWITSQHGYRVPLAMDWEREIPFYPASVVGYMSLYPLFLIVPFVLRERWELQRLGLALGLLIGLAGIGFLVFPGEPRRETLQTDAWNAWIQVADRLNLTYNFAPSLHVGLSVACVSALAKRMGWAASILLWGWALTIAISTLLLHEHYVIDVLTGWLMALLCVRWFFHTAQGTRQLASR